MFVVCVVLLEWLPRNGWLVLFVQGQLEILNNNGANYTAGRCANITNRSLSIKLVLTRLLLKRECHRNFKIFQQIDYLRTLCSLRMYSSQAGAIVDWQKYSTVQLNTGKRKLYTNVGWDTLCHFRRGHFHCNNSPETVSKQCPGYGFKFMWTGQKPIFFVDKEMETYLKCSIQLGYLNHGEPAYLCTCQNSLLNNFLGGRLINGGLHRFLLCSEFWCELIKLLERGMIFQTCSNPAAWPCSKISRALYGW